MATRLSPRTFKATNQIVFDVLAVNLWSDVWHFVLFNQQTTPRHPTSGTTASFHQRDDEVCTHLWGREGDFIPQKDPKQHGVCQNASDQQNGVGIVPNKFPLPFAQLKIFLQQKTVVWLDEAAIVRRNFPFGDWNNSSNSTMYENTEQLMWVRQNSP